MKRTLSRARPPEKISARPSLLPPRLEERVREKERENMCDYFLLFVGARTLSLSRPHIWTRVFFARCQACAKRRLLEDGERRLLLLVCAYNAKMRCCRGPGLRNALCGLVEVEFFFLTLGVGRGFYACSREQIGRCGAYVLFSFSLSSTIVGFLLGCASEHSFIMASSRL